MLIHTKYLLSLDFLDARLFAHGDDVAGELEVLHVVEPI